MHGDEWLDYLIGKTAGSDNQNLNQISEFNQMRHTNYIMHAVTRYYTFIFMCVCVPQYNALSVCGNSN